MTLVLDTSVLIVFSNSQEPLHRRVQQLIETEPGPLVVPAPITAEVDYLLGDKLGRHARRAFLEDVASGRFRIECLQGYEYELINRMDDTYASLDAGLADLSIVVIAHRFGTNRIATLDERHFRTLRPIGGGSFTLLPSDQP